MNITLDKAVNLIGSTLYLHNDSYTLPYFFIVGAGISAPEIPLSDGIIELCKKEINKRSEEFYEQCAEEMQQYETNASKRYSGWIERAFPNSVDRSRFFRRIIKRARISSGNLLLAQILSSRKIATTVFTTNFDDKLKQALELVGVTDLFVAENDRDNLVVSDQNEDIQIVHVHGTYNFYDCANLENEIQSVAAQNNNTISSASILSRFLTHHAPIIVGYSGWENDVIMTCLKKRLSYPTPLTYIWVCYSQESYNVLPLWLRNSPNVAFVIPESYDAGCEEEGISSQYFHKEFRIRKDILEATTFFNVLISSTKLSVPEIFENPFSYYSKRIDRILPRNEDVLHLRHWADRMKLLGSLDSDFEKLVKQLEHADVTNDIDTATSVLQEITKNVLSVADVRFTCESLITGLLDKDAALNSVKPKSHFRLAVLDFIDKNYDDLLHEGILHDCLIHVLLIPYKISGRDEHFPLLDKIVSIAQRNNSTLDVQLSALGFKSELATDEQMELSLLNSIIDLTNDYIDDPDLHYYRCIALYKLANILSDNEAINAIESADAIIQTDDGLRLQTISMIAKAKNLRRFTNQIDVQNRWISEIIAWVTLNSDRVDPYGQLEIASYFSRLGINLLTQFAGMVDYLIGTYEKCKDLDFNYCEHALWISSICATLSHISGNAREKALYYDKFKIYRNHLLPQCVHTENLKKYALYAYCKNPIAIVPDQLKIEEIRSFKNDYPDDNDAIILMLQYALEVGDIKQYECCDDLKEELKYCKNQETLSEGYNLYIAKDYRRAEECFISLISCPYDDIRNQAKNNLAFMLRRKETVQTNKTFGDIVNDIPQNYVFKHMNTILYCISENIMDDPRYTASIEYLKTMTEEEKENLLGCWTNVEMVGEAESKLALTIIKQASESDKGE